MHLRKNISYPCAISNHIFWIQWDFCLSNWLCKVFIYLDGSKVIEYLCKYIPTYIMVNKYYMVWYMYLSLTFLPNKKSFLFYFKTFLSALWPWFVYLHLPLGWHWYQGSHFDWSRDWFGGKGCDDLQRLGAQIVVCK